MTIGLFAAHQSNPPPAKATILVAIWLALCCLLVLCMIVLGGAVRLTGSGLSMVDWQPVMGIIPPLGHNQWLEAFAKYQQFPQFQLINTELALSQFKFLFWMEYAHRLLGRIIGLVYFLPFLWFIGKRILPHAMLGQLSFVLLLGAAQGLLGWYMVKSGLIDEPRISPYRLVLHFMLAVFIYAYLLRLAVGFILSNFDMRLTLNTKSPPKTAGYLALTILFLMLASGALVAGNQAGLVYNSWPKMHGLWIPQQLLAMHPVWLNFLENIATVQFVHRWLASLVLLTVGYFATQLLRHAQTGLGYLILIILAVQLLLGITTLLLQVPTVLGIAHQTGAMLLLTVVVVAVCGTQSRILPKRW